MSRDIEVSVYTADNGVSIVVDRYSDKLPSVRHNAETYTEAAEWIAAQVEALGDRPVKKVKKVKK